MEVQKLYGVVHGIDFQRFFSSAHAALKPSKELLEELGKLPKGTSVGLEVDTGLKRLIVKGEEFVTTDSEYWDELALHCRNNGSNVLALENSDIMAEACMEAIMADNAKENASNANNQASMKYWMQKAYEHSVAHDYIHQVKKDLSLLVKIAELKPEIVIVGRGHADYFWSRQDVADAHGIKFLNYACEDEPKIDDECDELLKDRMLIASSEGLSCDSSEIRELLPPNVVSYNPHIDAGITARKTSTERRYNAVKKGRITENGKKPDFIGTWEIGSPWEGLFEMFIKMRQGSKISGTIEDTLGTADFSGELTAEEIYFVKEYLEPSFGGASGKIMYSGKKEGGKFVGKWHHKGFSSPFEMRPFNG